MKKHLLFSIIAYILISVLAKVYAQAPNLTYPSPNTYTVGSSVTLTPANGGNPATSASVTPTLPAGLSIGSDGTISGTPTTVTAAADYTVTASNTDGSSTAIVNITINPQLPVITYPTPNTFVGGTAITTLNPTNTGGAASSYSISPTLPAGLIFDTGTGAISGTPTTVTGAADYTVTATNITGDGTFPVNITVNPALPNITYTTPNTFVVGTAITALNPSNTGGAIANYAISPALPAGLNFDTSTGIISGTPTTVTSAADYTVTATNMTGNSSFPVNITVNPALPNITYTTPNTFVAGTAITALNPANTGGGIASYTINPALPAGLNFDTSTGIISGTPTTVTAAADYTVTATNVTGNGTFPVNITVNPALPNITYNSPNTFTYGTAIAPLSPTNTGGAIVSYSVSPALPAGLVLNTSTGVISGTPTAAIIAADYTVTATNITGNSTFPVNITVSKVVLTVTVNNQGRIYGAADPVFTATYTGFVNSDTQASINTLATISTTATAASPVGNYPISAIGASDNNYTFSYVDGTLAINQAALTITANNQTKIYGATFTFAGTEFTTSGLVNSDVVSGATFTSSGSAATATVGASPYAIVPSAATGTGLANYAISYVNGSMTVNKAALTVTADNQAKTYGSPFTFAGTEFTTSGLVNSDAVASATLTSAGSAATATVAGSPYSIVPTAATGTGLANYNITYNNGTMTVNKAALTVTANNQVKTYGAAFTFAGTEFTTSGLVNSDAVTSATLTSTGSAATATVAGSPYSIIPTAATGTGLANYNITYTNGTMTVNKAALSVTANNQTKTYGATFTFAGTEFTTAGLKNADAVTSATITSAGSAATATVAGSPYSIVPTAATGTGLANYTITYNNGTMTVNKAALSVTANNQTKTYGATFTFTGTEFTTAGLKNADAVTSATITSTGSVATATVAGSPYSIIPTAATGTGLANYNITYNNGTMTVNKAALTVIANNQSKTYGSTFTFSGTEFTTTGLKNADAVTSATLTSTGSAATATVAGSPYNIVPSAAIGSGLANYNIGYTNGTMTVGKAVLTITANNQSKTYAAVNPALTVSYSGFVNADNQFSLTAQPTATTTAVTGSPVGTYPITANGAVSSNYTFTYIGGTLTVNKAVLTVTANNQSKAYGAVNPALTIGYSGFVNGDSQFSLTTQPTATTTAVTGSAVGTYPITPAGGVSNNYSFNYIGGTLTVNKAVLTITANNQTKIYGSVNPALTVSYAGFVNGDTNASLTTQPTATTTATTGSAVNTYPITANGAVSPNYTFSYVGGTLTVTKALLTVTANNQSKTYGSANPALTITYAGFVNGDTPASLTTQPTATTTATTGSGVGTYPITPAGGVSNNYTFSYSGGTLTVNQATITVTANNKTKTYGQANPALTVTYTGFVNGDTQAVINTLATVTTTAVTGSPVSTYPITANGASDNNYTFSYVPGTLTVIQAALTITANNQSKIQGSPNPVLTVTYSGFVNGDTNLSLTTQPTVTTTATTGSAVGTYPITANGAVDNNYAISYNGGTLTVNPQAPVITYPTPDVFVVGTFATISPTSTGGAVANYSIAPGLPAGLTINAGTGVISGTPTTVTAAANYTVTATNVTSSTTFVVNITVNPALPHIAYTTPDIYGVGTTISLSPTSTGGPVASYSAPSLPAGLTINPATGVISGTPSTITGAAGYVVTATNITGSFPFTVTITVNAAGANSYDWTGAVSTAWANPLNWQVNGIQQTTNYPGSSSTADAARIGVNTAIATFTNQPLLSAGNITIASITFGNNNAAVNNNTGGVISLTVNTFTLTVTGAITQNHSATGGNSTNDVGVTTTLLGNGAITCASLTVGDNTTLPANFLEVATTVFDIGNATASTLSVTVSGDLTINSASTPGGTLIVNNSNAYVSLAAGTLTVNGTIREVTGSPTSFYFLGQYAPSAQFSIDLNNVNTPVLNLGGATAINIGTNSNNNANNSVDFYNPVAFPHKASTVNYTGASQKVYYFNNSTTTNSLIDNNGEANGDGYVYQNIGFSGSGTKTLDAGTFKVSGNFALAAGSEIVNLGTNNPTLYVGGNYSTGAGSTFNNGSSPVTLNGAFSNDGTSNFGTPLLTFNNPAINPLTLTTSTPQALTNVLFSGSGVTLMKQTGTGAFTLASTGVLSMSGTAHVNVTNATLTLLSDANSSATVANIPSTCILNGLISVQRYLTGHRGYRLISSPVWTATVAPNNVYSLNYVGNSAFLTGTTGTGGGFDQGPNPTLYLYRENLVPAFTTFLNSNFRGINNIISAPNYTLDTDGGPFNIPVGNGFLFFFRGNKADGTLAQETTTTWPATTATLSTTGNLNVGNVTVHDWYTPASGFLGNTTVSGLATVEGTNLVGNPYASSIDWDQWNAGIIETNISKFSYKLVTTGLQGSGNYDVYAAGTATKKGTQGTANANIIVSGEGFFVQAIGANPVLTFTEAAKTNTQVSGGSLYMSKLPITAAVPQYLRLQIAMDTINTDGTIINFDDNSKITFDPTEDARYKVGTGKVSMSSFSSDHTALAINQLPLIHRGQSIALNVGATKDGTYKIKMSEIQGVPQLLNIWLKDKYLKDSVNMRVDSTYSFNILHSDTSSFGSNRFELVTDQNPSFAYHLLDFNAEKVKTARQVQVLWKTVYEENYTFFAVERSTDNGKTFNVIGSVAANNQGTYSLLDPKPIVGQNLYRLKQVDYNNVISYSKIIPVSYSDKSNNTAANNISVFPNPASSNINLAVLSDSGTGITYEILVTNSVGFVIRKATTNQPNWESNVSDLLPGTYLVKVFNSKDKSFIGSTKFVKLL